MISASRAINLSGRSFISSMMSALRYTRFGRCRVWITASCANSSVLHSFLLSLLFHTLSSIDGASYFFVGAKKVISLVNITSQVSLLESARPCGTCRDPKS